MSILSTLNKLTGKSDKNVLAALNSLTGKTADDIEEAMGNLGGGGAQIGKLVKIAYLYHGATWDSETIGINISDLVSGYMSWSAITLGGNPIIAGDELVDGAEEESGFDPHQSIFETMPNVFSVPVGTVLSTEGVRVFEDPDYSPSSDTDYRPEADKLQYAYIIKVDDNGDIVSFRPWDLNKDPIYYTIEYNDEYGQRTSRMRYFDIIAPDIEEDEIAAFGYQEPD